MGAHNCSVLIIDDDSLHLTIYRWMPEREGYSCKTALVSETLDLPANDAIDLVLLDYRLNSSLTAVTLPVGAAIARLSKLAVRTDACLGVDAPEIAVI
jgi:CheY-like chemotaxis protein